MKLNNTGHAGASNRSTRRRALRTIAGVLIGTTAVGTAGARNHVTEIDGPTVIDEPGEYVLTEDISSNESPVIRIEADRVTLDGNDYTIETEDGDTGIEVIGVTNVTLSALSIGSVRNSFETNIEISNSKNCTVEHTTVRSGIYGIECQGDNMTLRHNSALRNYEGGITVRGSNNTLQNNEVTYNRDPIVVSGTNNTLRDNTTFAEEGIIIRGGRNTLVDNDIEAVNYPAITLRNSDNNTLTTNEVRSRTNSGIYLQSSDNNTVTRNELKDSWYESGIVLNESNSNTVVRNDIGDAEIIDNGENNRIHANITD